MLLKRKQWEYCKYQHIGLLGKHASNYIFAKLQKLSCKYNSMQVPVEMKLVAIKHQQRLFRFTQIIITVADY